MSLSSSQWRHMFIIADVDSFTASDSGDTSTYAREPCAACVSHEELNNKTFIIERNCLARGNTYSCKIDGCDENIRPFKGDTQRHLREHYPELLPTHKIRCQWKGGPEAAGSVCGKMMLLESLGRHIVNCHVKQVKHRCPICMKIGSWRQDAARRHAVSCFVKRVDGGGDVGGSVLEEASSVSGERHQNSPYAATRRQNERTDEENWTPEEPRIEVKREIDDDYDEPESEDEVDELEDDMDGFEDHTD